MKLSIYCAWMPLKQGLWLQFHSTPLDWAICRGADLLLSVVDADLETVDEEDAQNDLEDRGVIVREDDRFLDVIDNLRRPLPPDWKC